VGRGKLGWCSEAQGFIQSKDKEGKGKVEYLDTRQDNEEFKKFFVFMYILRKGGGVADRHLFFADPDPSFKVYADPEPVLNESRFMWIRKPFSWNDLSFFSKFGLIL